MNPKSCFSILLICVLGSSLSAQNVKLKLISDQLSHPTAMAVTPKFPAILFVCEQEGRIRIIENGKLLQAPFLDITKEVIKKEGYEERGLLGLTFHPNYAVNGKFYVFCSTPSSGVKGRDHQSEVREYTVTKGNPKLADAASKKLVIAVDEPQSNHNGGDLKFGPDGLLYIALGDGGGQNDQHGQFGNAQHLNSLLGKILRIDVNNIPYAIPADNPFANTANAKPEIYAFGFRNPWRFSFDNKTKALFAGDVGQDKYEEVDIVTKGGNYGWRAFEGFHAHRPSDPQPEDPISPLQNIRILKGSASRADMYTEAKPSRSLLGNMCSLISWVLSGVLQRESTTNGKEAKCQFQRMQVNGIYTVSVKI